MIASTLETIYGAKEYLEKYNGVNEYSMVESALEQVRVLESLDFNQIKISLKASNVPLSIRSYTKMSEVRNYPLHLGVQATMVISHHAVL